VRLFRREPFTAWRAVTDVLTSEEDGTDTRRTLRASRAAPQGHQRTLWDGTGTDSRKAPEGA